MEWFAEPDIELKTVIQPNLQDNEIPFTSRFGRITGYVE